MFKSLIGRGHPEFSTMKQQDAMEFFQHFLQAIDRLEKSLGNPSTASCFKFTTEDRIECNTSHMVKYSKRQENILPLPIPIEKATNLDKVHEFEEVKKALSDEEKKKLTPVRPLVPLVECLKLTAAPEFIDNFYSTATKTKGFFPFFLFSFFPFFFSFFLFLFPFN